MSNDITTQGVTRQQMLDALGTSNLDPKVRAILIPILSGWWNDTYVKAGMPMDVAFDSAYGVEGA